MISIIIPAYNEEKRIGHALEAYSKFFNEHEKENFEIIVVINNTKDQTEAVVKNYAKKFKPIKYLNFKQGGKGFAIKEGFKSANGDLIGFVDADLASRPEDFYDLVKNIDGYDGILASRYIWGAKISKQPFKRILASRVFNFIVRSLFMFNFRDTQCGCKLFKRGAVKAILPKLTITQWAFDIDLLYNSKRLGLRIKEYPTIWSEPGGSHIDLKKSSLQMLLAVVQLRLLTSMFADLFRFVKPSAGKLWHYFNRK